MKKFFLILSILVVCIGASHAQFVTFEKASTVNYNQLFFQHILVDNTDDGFTVYVNPFYTKGSHYQHSLLHYDKKKNRLTNTQLTLPKQCLLITAFPSGDGYFALYTRKVKSDVVLATARLDKKGSHNVTPTQRSVIGKYKKNVVYAAHSADGQRHAVVFETNDPKSTDYHVFVYDSDGTCTLDYLFTPKSENASYINDITVSNDGEVALLYGSFKRTRTVSHLEALNLVLVGPDKDFSHYRISTPDYDNLSVPKMALLKDGRHFIGLYYRENGARNDFGYFTYIFDRHNPDLVTEHHHAIPEQATPRSAFYITRHFDCDLMPRNILELENGNVVMLGERCGTFAVSTGQQGQTSYVNVAADIVAQVFDNQGNQIGKDILVDKYQRHYSSASLSYSDLSMRRHATYASVGLSFSSFAIGNDVYLLYNDHRDKGDEITYFTFFKGNYNNSCVRMTKISPDGVESQKVLDNDQYKKFYHNLWTVDAQDVFFGMYGGLFGKDYGIGRVSFAR